MKTILLVLTICFFTQGFTQTVAFADETRPTVVPCPGTVQAFKWKFEMLAGIGLNHYGEGFYMANPRVKKNRFFAGLVFSNYFHRGILTRGTSFGIAPGYVVGKDINLSLAIGRTTFRNHDYNYWMVVPQVAVPVVKWKHCSLMAMTSFHSRLTKGRSFFEFGLGIIGP